MGEALFENELRGARRLRDDGQDQGREDILEPLWQREKEPELYDAIKEVAPEWWGDETRIILNEDLVAKRHKDGNKGHSWLLWLGDYTSGGG